MGTRAILCGAVLTASLLPAVAKAELLYGITLNNEIVSFDSAAPAAAPLSLSAITGLTAVETLLGLDLRPATGRLYTFSDYGNLYLLQDQGATYAANLVGNIGFAVSSLFTTGLDFNPVVDRLRYVDSLGLNMRINPDTGGLVAIDTSVPHEIQAVAYSNNVAGAASTLLYGIDAATDQLMVSATPNSGTYSPVGVLSASPQSTSLINFDISGPTGLAYMSIDQALFSVNLATGASPFVGQIAAGPLRGLTAAGATTAAIPEPSAWALLIAGFGFVGAALRRRCSRRFAPI